MQRRDFIKQTSLIGGGLVLANSNSFASINTNPNPIHFSEAMRWAQLAFVESDPGNFDPDFWLSYFKKNHVQGALLTAGGIVAFYPTKIPFHHRSKWMGDTDPLGYMIKGCRKLNMSVILRTDAHATHQDTFDAHPDWIAVLPDGEKRKHWANPELWVTCGLGPYNFNFMTSVHKELMELYEPDAIFSNRWAGHGICYCEHCKTNFKSNTGLDLPKSTSIAYSTRTQNGDRFDPVYRKYVEWRNKRLQELWFLWNDVIRQQKSTARFIPNGFPDKVIAGKHSEFFFSDQQTRSGFIPPWLNGYHAKELRATMGMKPQVGIFSVGFEEAYRWKDSVQNEAETRVWVSEGLANGLLPCFVKFSAVLYDKRWLPTIEKIYQRHYKIEHYLKNTAPMARVAMVYSEQTDRNYGGKPWQQNAQDHGRGMYHALIEDRMPFEMVNDQLLDAENLKDYKLLILPNIAALSDKQCEQIKNYVQGGGSIVATFETSLYDEEGTLRKDYGLKDLFGVSFYGGVEGPMQNSYLRLKNDPVTNQYHPVLKGLEDAFRIINGTHRVKVSPKVDFPSPVTLIPSYPDVPMEELYPRVKETNTRELYLREIGKGRVAFIPWDIDRSFWQIMNVDHGTLLRNVLRWALGEEPLVDIKGPGVLDVTMWRQQKSMTVHLVNMTNPMMLKGPFRELIPVPAEVSIKIPDGVKVGGVRLLIADTKPLVEKKQGWIKLKIEQVVDHEIVAIDLA